MPFYGRHRKLGVDFRTTGYGRHRSQWVKGNLAENQPKNHQNVQKRHFLQKVPGVNGLIDILVDITAAVESYHAL